ncbi:nucleotidyltransferase domain-containing protein [Candidatus Nomurabacteria bacterium]|nr:nucleotidyltransferase domain-containing protein [Candidatus Nomurabacteria bacterium]
MEKCNIQPIGTYLEIDSAGYLIPEVSFEKIQEKWKPLLNDYIDLVRKHYGANTHSIYVRGSVAKGKAIDGVSDFDAMIVVNEYEDNETRKIWLQEVQEKLLSTVPFVTKIEMGTYTPQDILSSPDRVLLKLQSLCVYGSDLRAAIEPLRPGAQTIVHAHHLERAFKKTYQKFAEKNISPEDVQKWCTWIMKRMLRVGHEIVAERSQRFTRELYTCWEGFSKYYPQKKDDMYHVLELAIYPTERKEEVLDVLDGIGKWLIGEVDVLLS